MVKYFDTEKDITGKQQLNRLIFAYCDQNNHRNDVHLMGITFSPIGRGSLDTSVKGTVVQQAYVSDFGMQFANLDKSLK